jgi:hypothetical protein
VSTSYAQETFIVHNVLILLENKNENDSSVTSDFDIARHTLTYLLIMFWNYNIFTPTNSTQPKSIYGGIEFCFMLTIFNKTMNSVVNKN